jgi:hypothetical protein
MAIGARAGSQRSIQVRPSAERETPRKLLGAKEKADSATGEA